MISNIMFAPPAGNGTTGIRSQPVHLVFGEEEKDSTGQLKKVETFVLGYWRFLCDPAFSDWAGRFDIDGGVDIALDLGKIKKAAGLIGKYLKDEDLQNFINDAKDLLPSGEAAFAIKIVFDPIKELCPDSKTCAAFIGYKLFAELTAGIKGSYGVIKASTISR